jgi:chloramphenicol O-acetyltransferase type A
MKVIDINKWNRKLHFNHFNALSDPYFSITIPIDVTKAYRVSKNSNISFFAKYLHDCMRAINNVENLKYRILDNQIVEYDVIHASPTLMRKDNTYGFSFIDYNGNLDVFIKNIESEKARIESTLDLYPPKNGLDCIHCSALPWFSFSGHKEPFSGVKDSVPKVAFSKAIESSGKLEMNVAISVNHALADGYHISLFVDAFQDFLNSDG